ncbi:hypothetical protein FA15DRAFT_760566 [Coprinopsis marcescibilis]|uniref:Uncharacterized protein n=1 Tax=Coprinopsis marcescibilis TaxID=230819 RepID=A0A5C3KF88_COPMA|nr:hypothetical protein FA15DRAFT_760566 [Coprinopsis marcescibilis]
MPFFNKSHWISIFGGEFTDVKRDLHVHSHIHLYYGQQVQSTPAAAALPQNDRCESEPSREDKCAGIVRPYQLVPQPCPSAYPLVHYDTGPDKPQDEQHTPWSCLPLNNILLSISAIWR